MKYYQLLFYFDTIYLFVLFIFIYNYNVGKFILSFGINKSIHILKLFTVIHLYDN